MKPLSALLIGCDKKNSLVSKKKSFDSFFLCYSVIVKQSHLSGDKVAVFEIFVEVISSGR